jgi:hypothetical protein
MVYMGKGFNLQNTNTKINMHGPNFKLIAKYKNMVYGIDHLKHVS